MTESTEVTENPTFIRQMRRRIHGAPLQVHCMPPPGFATECLQDLQQIANSTLLPAKAERREKLTLTQTEGGILANEVDFSLLMEWVSRSLVVNDIFLTVAEARLERWEGIQKLVDGSLLPWILPEKKQVEVKTNSVASRLFHEGRLRDELAMALSRRGWVPQWGEDARTANASPNEHPARLHLHLHHDKAQLRLACSNRPLSHRDYRARLEAVAPLREDLAAGVIRAILSQSTSTGVEDDCLLIPFAGTGTFAFEGSMQLRSIAPMLLGRRFGCEDWLCFKQSSWDWLHSKLAETCRQSPNIQFCCIEKSKSTAEIFSDNSGRFAQQLTDILDRPPAIRVLTDDFFTFDLSTLPWNTTKRLIMPLNPPYGIRLKRNNTTSLYRDIGRRVVEVAARGLSEQINEFIGGILCPDEPSWRSFCEGLKGAKIRTRTQHFTQGGRDIRLCLFAQKH